MNSKKSLNMPADAALPSVLAIDSVESDRQILENIVRGSCRVAHASSAGAALQSLRKSRYAVVLCDTDLPRGSWQQVLQATFPSFGGPLLIVTSRLADETLWAEALNLGAWDVLAKPFDAQEVTRVLSFALHQWHLRNSATARPARPATEAVSIETAGLSASAACA